MDLSIEAEKPCGERHTQSFSSRTREIELRFKKPSAVVVLLVISSVIETFTATAEAQALACARKSGNSGDQSAVTRTTVKSLVPIPEDAELILAAPWAGTKSKFGFPANELYAVDGEGKNRTQITHNTYHYNHFAVSPDRKMIAAIRYSDGDTNKNRQFDFLDKKTLWLIDLANKQEWPLMPEYDAGWGGVVWSPDGQFIYLSVFKDSKTDIYRIRPDGSGLKNITQGIETVLTPDLPQKRVTDVGISPDGEWIAFVYSTQKARRLWKKSFTVSRIAMCRVDGAGASFVTDGGGIEPLSHGPWGPGDFDPEFSPDGKRICFGRATAASVNFASKIPSHDIMRVKIDGTGLKRLSPAGNTGVHGIADWSHDNRIVFSEWNQADNYVGLVLVDVDGKNCRRLKNLPKGGSHARWLPPISRSSGATDRSEKDR